MYNDQLFNVAVTNADEKLGLNSRKYENTSLNDHDNNTSNSINQPIKISFTFNLPDIHQCILFITCPITQQHSTSQKAAKLQCIIITSKVYFIIHFTTTLSALTH